MSITVDTSVMQEVGQNLKATVVADQLVIVVPLNGNIGPSSTGKMLGVASTGGFAPLPGGLKGNLYIGKKVG